MESRTVVVVIAVILLVIILIAAVSWCYYPSSSGADCCPDPCEKKKCASDRSKSRCSLDGTPQKHDFSASDWSEWDRKQKATH